MNRNDVFKMLRAGVEISLYITATPIRVSPLHVIARPNDELRATVP